MHWYSQSLLVQLYVDNRNLMLTQYSMTNGVTFLARRGSKHQEKPGKEPLHAEKCYLYYANK